MRNKPWKTGLAAIVLGTMIIQGAVPALADGVGSAAVVSAPSVNYGLTNDIRAAIKSVAVTPTANGSQISATVRLYNGGESVNRVPEHELRVRTTSGIVYTLKPSVGNKAALQPHEIGELVYMADIDSKEITQIDQLSFVNVDLYSYPKKETTLLAMPTTSVWYGTGASAPQVPDTMNWGQAFTIPGVNSGLVYTPVDVTMQNTSTGRAAVVTVLAENPGTGREIVPDFRLDAQSDQKSYVGTRTETGSVALEAGEKKYIHFAIPVENSVTPSKLLVVSTDNFVAAAGSQPVVLATGKAAIAWPASTGSEVSAPAYTIGTPIAFDNLTTVIDKKTQVSLMELTLHENPGEGYKTAVAKFKLTNTSDVPTATPAFLSQLGNAQGVTYQGTRQTNVTAMMNPGLSYVVSYSFIVPQSETGTSFALKLLDGQSVAPFTTTIAALQTNVQEDSADDVISMYPFDLKFNSITVGSITTPQLTYTYKFTLDLDITQKENVVVDNNFSKLRFEIVDNAGRVVGSKDAALTGDNKLVSGKQTLDASNIASDQMSSPFTVNVYEVIDTPSGTAKRLLKTVKS